MHLIVNLYTLIIFWMLFFSHFSLIAMLNFTKQLFHFAFKSKHFDELSIVFNPVNFFLCHFIFIPFFEHVWLISFSFIFNKYLPWYIRSWVLQKFISIFRHVRHSLTSLKLWTFVWRFLKEKRQNKWRKLMKLKQNIMRVYRKVWANKTKFFFKFFMFQ